MGQDGALEEEARDGSVRSEEEEAWYGGGRQEEGEEEEEDPGMSS